MGYTTSCWPLGGTAPHRGPGVRVSAAQAVARSRPHVRWLDSLPASSPYSLKSLDSNPSLRLCFGGKYLNLHSLRETQNSNSELSQNSYFFFPSKKRADCGNLNCESSKSKLPGIFAITFSYIPKSHKNPYSLHSNEIWKMQ